MGPILLVCRLAARDLRHRPAEAVLLLIAITAAATTLTLGLALHGTASQPYQQTRAATAGPDIVAEVHALQPQGGPPANPARLIPLIRTPGITGHSGPYPYTFATIHAGNRSAEAFAEGRDEAPAAVDQPKLTQGGWIGLGEVVIERSFADALGVRSGDQVTLNGRPFTVAGVAVSAAYPQSRIEPGLIWLTRADARALATAAAPLSYLLNLKIADPAGAEASATAYDNSHQDQAAPYLMSWQSISDADAHLVAREQQILVPGSWLLGLLAVASVAVLVGGRMAGQARRVGLLKAAGGTPGLVAAVLLAEQLAVAGAAAAVGLLVGWLAAPLLSSPGAGLLGTAGTPSLTPATIGVVVAAALGTVIVATLAPAVRAARTSTVAALAGASRPPHRSGGLIAVSARLPVPLLLGLRLAARRPRRTLLSLATITVTGTGIIAVLLAHAAFGHALAPHSGLDDPQNHRLSQVMLVLTVALIALSAVNAILITWATVLDARHPSAVTRALGATPRQLTAGLVTAQALPAAAGALLGIPGGTGLFAAVHQAGPLIMPPAWWLIATVLAIPTAAAAITVIPARLGARRPPAQALQAELA